MSVCAGWRTESVSVGEFLLYFLAPGLQVEVAAAGVSGFLRQRPAAATVRDRFTSLRLGSGRFCPCGVTAISVFFDWSVWGPRVL